MMCFSNEVKFLKKLQTLKKLCKVTALHSSDAMKKLNSVRPNNQANTEKKEKVTFNFVLINKAENFC